MKRCTKCDLKKDLHEFYKSNSTVDGFHNSCKECWKLARKKRYVKNRDKVRKQCRKYYLEHQEDLKAKARKQIKPYSQTKGYRQKNPEKYKAHYMVSNALKRGDLIKAEYCKLCNSSEKLEAHHPDYSKPLDVVWLCRCCHLKIHNKEE